jgi:uncharacterized protein YbjT (DUF2867 family)
MKALVIGASGATGKDLTVSILNNPNYSAVVIFVRRPTGLAHSKLKEVITDFENIKTVSTDITGDVLFSCLGTTFKTAGSKEAQRHVDYEIPSGFAAEALHNGVPAIVLLSAYGASPKSNIFYSRLKGELEDTIDKFGFTKYIIFRPGLLIRKDTDRLGERLFASVLKVLNIAGLFLKFKPIRTSILANKMAKAALKFPNGKHVLELKEIFEF